MTLAIDSWCFGERKHEAIGQQGEEDAFKLMLWRGQVLWGMMMFDELRALNYLAAGGSGSGAVGRFWHVHGRHQGLVAGRSRSAVTSTTDVCCLTDYESIIATHGLHRHGVYYFVPALLKHFDTFQINELIVPRAHLSVNGRKDNLTPPVGVEKVRDQLLPCRKVRALRGL